MLIDKLINNDMIVGPLIILTFVILGLILCGLVYILRDLSRINTFISTTMESIKNLLHRRK